MNIVASLLLAISVLAAFPAAATEMEERQAIISGAAAEFAAENFAWLDAMAGEFRRGKSRTSSGFWHLSLFYAGLEGTIDAAPDPIKAGPNSSIASDDGRKHFQTRPRRTPAQVFP